MPRGGRAYGVDAVGNGQRIGDGYVIEKRSLLWDQQGGVRRALAEKRAVELSKSVETSVEAAAYFMRTMILPSQATFAQTTSPRTVSSSFFVSAA